jgi:hypothetical protein
VASTDDFLTVPGTVAYITSGCSQDPGIFGCPKLLWIYMETTEIQAAEAMSEKVISKTEASYEGIAFVTYGDGSQEIHYDVNNHGDAADQARESYAQRLAQRQGIPARKSGVPAGVVAA